MKPIDLIVSRLTEKFGKAIYKGKEYPVIDIQDKGAKGNFFILKGVSKPVHASEIQDWFPA